MKKSEKWLDKSFWSGRIKTSPDEGTDLMRCLTDLGRFFYEGTAVGQKKMRKKAKKAFDKCVEGAKLSTSHPEMGRAGWNEKDPGVHSGTRCMR